ncbi:MAG TPA: M15 family metallopeptidase [Acidimicrobiales bacterium]|nr:M15 family metallopeptidase [Acidimicrobiales bacterium]
MIGTRRAPAGVLVVAAAVIAAGAACGSAPPTSEASAASRPPTSGSSPPTTRPPAPTSPPPPAAPSTTSTTSTSSPSPPPFAASVRAVTASELPYTWRPGCPVSPAQLRMLSLSFWGFDGRPHTGTMVVNASVVPAAEAVFRTLYDERFPIREMVPEDAYRGDDNAAAAADDTSGFNCRYAVAPGPPHWSVHAYGEAIDVNDVQNPYVDGTTVIPPAGSAYLDRADYRPGMAVPGGQLVDAFAAVGWYWGGRWTATPDYQHFSATGG